MNEDEVMVPFLIAVMLTPFEVIELTILIDPFTISVDRLEGTPTLLQE